MRSYREGLGEALTGGRIGQPSSRGRGIISGVDAVLFAEGETEGRVNRKRSDDPAWSKNLALRTLLVREPGDLTVDQQPSDWRAALVRVGKVRNRSR
jgi:hypothetical protein